MKRNQGFSLIEALIILVILGIIAAVAYPAIVGKDRNQDGSICKHGYKFTGRGDRSTQIIDSQGRGIPCNKN